jgi:spore coat protein U-like protein
LRDVKPTFRRSVLEQALFRLIVATALAATPALASGACVVTATSINFGSYPEISESVIVSVGSVSYTCIGPVPTGIKIVMGAGRSGSIAERAMIAGDARLPYILSLDQYGRAPWGDGSHGTQVYYNAHPPRNQTVTVPVFGFIPAGRRAPAGQIFRDSVAVVAFY